MLRDFNTKIFWLYLIITTSLVAVLIAIFSLSSGINDIFPYFFLLPMLLIIYAFPKRGILFTIALGWIYIILVYVFGTHSVRVIAVHTAWFYIYVSLGIVISSFVESSRSDKEQIERLKKEAFQQIEHNMAQFATLNDQIRNPLQAIMLDTITLDAEAKGLISEQVQIIEKILSTLDDKYSESENVRKFLRKHYGFKEKQNF
jgi:signal transduction histidine kinase